MKKHLIPLAVAACCALSSGAFAAMTKDEYKAEKEKIEAAHKADKEKCGALKDNAKDICQAESKGREKVAKARLESTYKPGAGNAAKLSRARADADYEVAKEKCDDLKGKEQSACKADAKAAHEKAKGEVKTARAEAKAVENGQGTMGASSSLNTTTAGQKR
jgi:hypothetical protein